MKLYYRPGASSLLPHIVLVEAGLSFEAVKVDEHVNYPGAASDYRKVNPLGYVPAVELDDGSILTETVAIAQYIADCAPDKNLVPPNGTLGRVKLQSWLNFICSEIQVGCFCPIFDRQIPDAVRTIFHRRLDTRLAHVEQRLTDNAYLLGGDFSIADVYLFVVTNWARPASVDLSQHPHLLSHRKRIGARPSVQEVMRREGMIQCPSAG
jgi:glutathione S-transferase